MSDKKESTGEKAGDSTNPFDPSHLRLSSNFATTVGVKKALITVPVRKPEKQDFVRVHPDEEYRLETALLEYKEERETYLVEPSLWPELQSVLTPKILLTTINRQGVVTLWPIRLPDENGRLDNWNSSALDAAKLAEEKWVKVTSNMSLGAYEVYEAPGNIPEPEWPDKSFIDILKVAYKNQYIDDLNHPVICRLLGEY